jgi:uncharacterized protein (TIGR03435 family)
MKPDERNIDEVLKHALPSAPRGEMEGALDRVHARLQSDAGEPDKARPTIEQRVLAPRVSGESSHTMAWKPLIRMVAAAVVVAAAVWAGASLRDQGVYAVLEAADGSMYRIADGNHVPMHVGDRIAAQETVRSDGAAGAVLALADGSHVEMRSMSELSWDHAGDGLKIRLDAGSIIVSAAKQAGGRLYVQTRDITASIAGTTSLVNAAEDGSRVAVIEGEAQVREGKIETTLRQGQQVSTSATLTTRPLKEELDWSRNRDAHLTILAAFEKGMAATAAPLSPPKAPRTAAFSQNSPAATRQEFEEASIRPCDPDNLPPAPDGARGGGPNSFQMTPGRTHVLCMTLATILRHAYGYGPVDLDFINPGGRGPDLQLTNVYGLGVEDGRRVRGGPNWVREEHYTIDAVAADAADAATMSGPMLRALLEKRFQLKSHIESEQVPAFDLTIARGGLKIKPVSAPGVQADGFVRAGVSNDACDQIPVTPGQPAIIRPRTFEDVRRGQKPYCGLFGAHNGPNLVWVAGGVALGGVARLLGSPLGVQVFDKTGNADDRFNFILEFAVDENTPGRIRFPPEPEPAANVPRAPTVFVALEEQLGLHLDPAKGQREFIVIDQVERPAPN